MAIKNKGRNPGYKPGDYWLICDRTGRAMRLSDARQEWNGLVVHKDEYETRHPQDLLRTRRSEQGPHSFVRPVPYDTSPAVCTVNGSSGVAGHAVAGCARVGGTTVIESTF